MQNRDRAEIIRQILDVANGGNSTRTKIMYEAFLSYFQLKEYLTILTEKNLITYDSVTQTYKTTEKGLRLIQSCKELDDMIKKASPTQSRR
jgi:predicted transcriptional regulator